MAYDELRIIFSFRFALDVYLGRWTSEYRMAIRETASYIFELLMHCQLAWPIDWMWTSLTGWRFWCLTSPQFSMLFCEPEILWSKMNMDKNSGVVYKIGNRLNADHQWMNGLFESRWSKSISAFSKTQPSQVIPLNISSAWGMLIRAVYVRLWIRNHTQTAAAVVDRDVCAWCV